MWWAGGGCGGLVSWWCVWWAGELVVGVVGWWCVWWIVVFVVVEIVVVEVIK